MSGQTRPNPTEDSLDRLARLMTLEETLINQIEADTRLAPGERKRLIREVEARIERAEFGDEDDFDEGALAALVRNLGPRPRGQAGTAARPEV